MDCIESIPFISSNLKYGFDLNLPEILTHIKWMMKKLSLRQDMYLLGPPGPIRRWLALKFCELTQREIEYVCLTRDTSESDLKQRRELLNKNLVYVNQAAVKAAINGRILVLDGLEKCERNVLPVLNNLLENREMHLEDGKFLVSPKRYKDISKKLSAPNPELVPVHPDFLVIALGLPTPKFQGFPLDPPLRSRFQARSIPPFNEETLYTILMTKYPQFDKALAAKLVSFVETINRINYNGEKDSDLTRLWSFPLTGIVDIVELLSQFPVSPMVSFILRVYPFILKNEKAEHDVITHALKNAGLVLDEKHLILKTSDYECKSIRYGVVDGLAKITFQFGKMERSICFQPSFYQDLFTKPYIMTNTINSHIISLLEDLLCGYHVCLIGGQGCGKTQLLNQLAKNLKAKLITLQLYKDINSKDLIQRRSTDSDGNTIWVNSPIVDAAIHGHFVVLDNIHYIGHGTLAIIQQLLFDGTLNLFDGGKLVTEETFQHYLQLYSKRYSESIQESKKRLESKGIRAIHKSFRIIATAAPITKKNNWINSEIISLFHFHVLNDLDSLENHTEIISSLIQLSNTPVTKNVFEFSKHLLTVKENKETNDELPVMSLRQDRKSVV